MRIGLNFIYAVLKLFPTQKNKVLFLSRQSNTLTLDFKMTQEELRRERPDIKIVTICHRLEGEGSGAAAFAKSTLKSMYHLATSSVCVLDAYWPAVSILHHKKSLTVIQMCNMLARFGHHSYSQGSSQLLGGKEIVGLFLLLKVVQTGLAASQLP